MKTPQWKIYGQQVHEMNMAGKSIVAIANEFGFSDGWAKSVAQLYRTHNKIKGPMKNTPVKKPKAVRYTINDHGKKWHTQQFRRFPKRSAEIASSENAPVETVRAMIRGYRVKIGWIK